MTTRMQRTATPGIYELTRAEYRRRLGLDEDGQPLPGTVGAVGYFGRMRLAEIGPRDIRRYAAHVAARGLARDTVRLALAPVKAMLATAAEDELIRRGSASARPSRSAGATSRGAGCTFSAATGSGCRRAARRGAFRSQSGCGERYGSCRTHRSRAGLSTSSCSSRSGGSD